MTAYTPSSAADEAFYRAKRFSTNTKRTPLHVIAATVDTTDAAVIESLTADDLRDLLS